MASEAPVCIVWAGPVGMCLATRFASFGIASVVLEANADLVPERSKGCLIQGDVLKILDKFGCATQIQAEGVTWHVGNTYARGRLIRKEVHDEPIGFGPFTNICTLAPQLDSPADRRAAMAGSAA